jgi:hypothetical protein
VSQDQLQLDWQPAPLRLPLEPERDRRRLKGAVLRVLERLRQGPATNLELADPRVGGLRAAARVHDLKRAGFAITSQHQAGEGPLWLYTLVSEPPA